MVIFIGIEISLMLLTAIVCFILGYLACYRKELKEVNKIIKEIEEEKNKGIERDEIIKEIIRGIEEVKKEEVKEIKKDETIKEIEKIEEIETTVRASVETQNILKEWLMGDDE